MKNTTGSVGFSGLLTIAFVVLKLTNFINWDWQWVLSPILIQVAIFIIIATLMVAKWALRLK